jgi:hypothetical protein
VIFDHHISNQFGSKLSKKIWWRQVIIGTVQRLKSGSAVYLSKNMSQKYPNHGASHPHVSYLFSTTVLLIQVLSAIPMAHKLNAKEPHVTPFLYTSFWLLIWPFCFFQKIVKHVASSLLFSQEDM